eukprot:987765-Pelagomonas_calceolata.AAC.2
MKKVENQGSMPANDTEAAGRRKDKSMPARWPRELRKGSLTSKLARVSSKSPQPKLDTASLGVSQKQI